MKKELLLLTFVINSLLLNAQAWEEKCISCSTIDARSVKPFDLNNDGYQDLLVSAVYDHDIVWYKNNGNGTFGQFRIIGNSLNTPTSIHATDLDNDGDLDVLATSIGDNLVCWYENMGNDEFGPIQIISNTEEFPYSIYSADFDNDGDQDLVCASKNSDRISLYINNGSGIFGASQTISTSADGANTVYSNDLDGDGDMDILVSSEWDNKIAWYINDGTGNFGNEQVISTTALRVRNVYSIDLDNDGDIDVLSASFDDDKITWYENYGSGVFSSENIISSVADGANYVYASDLDNDGDLDILSASNLDDKIAWYENDGFTNFGSEQLLNSSADFATGVYAADLNNDGYNDVISSSKTDNKIAWYDNNGLGNFSNEILVSTNTEFPNAIHSSDIDNDGDLDMLTTSRDDRKVRWFENVGNGQFSQEKIIEEVGLEPIDVYTSDLDGDGYEDVIVVWTSWSYDSLVWYKNNGNSTFGSRQLIKFFGGAGGTLTSVYSEDLDNDNDNDVLCTFNDGVFWFENLGGGNFGPIQALWSIGDPQSEQAENAHKVITADLNNDGNIDILSTSIGDNKVAWFENLGSGNFSTQKIISTSIENPSDIKATDLNHDGYLDILTIDHFGDELIWFKNNGNGEFGQKNIISDVAINILTINTGDVNGDGYIDIVSGASYNENILWYENNGLGVFSPQQIISELTHRVNDILTGDLDGDGDLEIITSIPYQNRVAYYNNNLFNSIKINGTVFFDENQNGIRDSLEFGLNQINIMSTPQSDFTYTNEIGDYNMVFNDSSGVYQVMPQELFFWNITSDSVFYTLNVSSSFLCKDSLDFGFYPDIVRDSLTTNLIGGFPECGSNINYWLNIQNVGSTISSGIIHLELDNNITFISSASIPDSINGQHIYWHYDSLSYFQNEITNIEVIMPVSSYEGDTVTSIISVFAIDTNSNIAYTSIDTLNQIISCSTDSNDKSVEPEGTGPFGYLLEDEIEFEYLIRFQNTGIDTALTVVINDQLDADLDWTTLQSITSSHPMQITVEQDGEMMILFEDIMLPDSNTNPLASQGFLRYKINTLPNRIPNTQFTNNASISFDYNATELTNTVINTIMDCSVIEMDSIQTTICLGEGIDITAFNDYISDYNWSINSFYDVNSNSLNWISDTFGSFQIHLTVDNNICNRDTVIDLLVKNSYIFNENVTICYGDSIFIYDGYKYTSGIYYDSLYTSLGCDSLFRTTLTVQELPAVHLNEFENVTTCIQSGSINLPSGTPVGGVYSGIGVSSTEFNVINSGLGSHTVLYTYTNEYLCVSSDSVTVNVVDCLSLLNGLNEIGILVYPNPNEGIFYIELPSMPSELIEIKIFDLQAKLIQKKSLKIDNKVIQIDMSEFNNGIYFIELIIDNEIFRQKIIKN